MSSYEYRGYAADGTVRKGLIEALSPKEAREKLVKQGVLAETVSAAGRRSTRMDINTRSIVYRELSALLEAGMPLDAALDVLIQSPEIRNVSLLAGVRDRVREGAPLATALAECCRSVSAFERAVIEVAEQSATVGGVLERLAAFLEEQDRLRERIKSALIYPAVVFCAGVLVAVVMCGVLLPRTRIILAQSNLPVPGLTRAVLVGGTWLVRWGWLAALVGVLGGMVLWRRIRENHEAMVRVSRALLRFPLLGRGYTALICLRFARTLSILLRGGVGLIRGLPLAGRATGSAWVAELVAREAESVKEGVRLSDAIRRIPPLAESLPGWLQVGEASGDLEGLLDTAADRFDTRWERFLKRALGLLEPALLLIVAGFVLLIALAVLLPILSLSDAVGG